MDSADNSALKDFFVTLASPEVLAEVIAIVIASLIAVAGTHAVRNWHRKHAPPGPDASTADKLIEGCVLVAPYFFATVVMSTPAALMPSRSPMPTIRK